MSEQSKNPTIFKLVSVGVKETFNQNFKGLKGKRKAANPDKSRVCGFSLVAEAGFEPTTFGL
jgi:hypothetical protein